MEAYQWVGVLLYIALFVVLTLMVRDADARGRWIKKQVVPYRVREVADE